MRGGVTLANRKRDMKNKSQFNNISRKEQDPFIAAETDSFMSKLTRF
jgi:hypothetical protein